MDESDSGDQMTFVLPLENLITKLQPFPINLNIMIRKLTRKEKKELVNRSGPIEVTYPKVPLHCLEVKAKNVNPAAGKAYPVISALRLLKSNLVGINQFILPENLGVYRHPGSMEVDTSLTSLITKGPYILEESDKISLLGLYDKINKMIVDKKLRFALGRLNMAYSSKWLGTRLLNYMFALESLYLPRGPELKFRLCCYMTCILSSGSEDKTKDVWNYIDEAYDLRSDIVHGSGSLPPKICIGEGEEKTEVSAVDFVDRLGEYTRQSIKEVIRREKKVKEFQSMIKEEVITRLFQTASNG